MISNALRGYTPTFNAAITSRSTGKFHAIKMAMNMTHAAMTVLVSVTVKTPPYKAAVKSLTKLIGSHIGPRHHMDGLCRICCDGGSKTVRREMVPYHACQKAQRSARARRTYRAVTEGGCFVAAER